MRWVAPLTVLAACAAKAVAADSFTGTSNFYAYALPKSEQQALLQGMSDAGMKVLRTFVQGVPAGQKGSDNIQVNDVEGNGIGQWDDTILNAIDELMVLAQGYGVKLLISMYDKNTLAAGGPYNAKYGESGFYTNSDALSDYSNRITYILNTHKNSQANNQPWSELGDYIFGYDVMNEPMINQGASFFESNLDWVCNVAKQIRGNVGDANQLIFTGGNSAGVSVQDRFFESDCAIDAIAVHDYTDGYDSYLPDAISKANSAGKKLIIEEWGSLVGGDRDSNLQSNVQKMNQYGVSWIYWELITNTDPNQGEDYEIDIGGDDWSTIQSLAKTTAGTTGAFDFSASL
ncbi:glycoside hydrolase family 5 protein [Coniophora puteana RWD-64-598 SS2]|uniref:mannan endo-1,4-beta-mannosidase n=1 Tax=Coniophora puteana (strain RWD-64-598) TaxID=741705 RepID=A0A5M3M8S3_CONPW|nr:glycoside hydrolase family 5 protein [Coniophora puteana RWD-64-598 SS2]EIW75190.1 glycoside hydrolase family 5 protein [Coniophora puteana RWD-64-598 SS2]